MYRIGDRLKEELARVRARTRLGLEHNCARCQQRMESGWQWLTERIGKGSNSLANRILVLQFAWAMVVYVLVIVALWFATSVVIEKSLLDQGEGWVSKLDELGTPLYASEDPARPSEIISDLHKFPEVASVQYFDAGGGNVIARYEKRHAPTSNFLPLNEAGLEQLRVTGGAKKPLLYEEGRGQQIRISAPIWIKSIASDGMLDFSLEEPPEEKTQVIGFLSVVLDYSHIYHQLHRTLRNASVVIALLMLLAAVVGRVLIRWALSPLAMLEVPLTRLANGETDVKVESSGDREIAKIGMALNTTISAIKERDETLRRMANHDALTGLVNRNYFTEQLEREIGRIGAQGGSSALFFIDLDRFKFINDTYGHAAGDRLLTQVAELLKQRMREGDVIARFGGDEFTALLPRVNARGAREIAASLIELMRGFEFHEGGEVQRIHFSIGVALIDDGEQTAHDYILQADSAVHVAKSAGRNGFHFFEADAKVNHEELNGGWYERLREAIDGEQLRLFYQPLLGLREQGETVYEVLLRIPDLQYGVLAPGAFFPAAERFGLMSAIDRQVIAKAAKKLQQTSLQDSVLSINLSAQIFQEEDFADFLEAVFNDSGLDARRFIFEVSEQLAVRHIEQLKSLFQRLNALGCRLAIDDFGSGFASFKYLKHVPVQWIKIDGALIERLQGDKVDQITVRSIAESAAELGVETVAKFVPNEATLRILQGMGIGYAQGDYLGKAGPELSREQLPHLKLVK